MSTPVSRLANYGNDSIAHVPISSSEVDSEMNAWVAALNRKVVAKSTAPSSPTLGDTWVDTSSLIVKQYDGSAWQEIGGVTYSTVKTYSANDIVAYGGKLYYSLVGSNKNNQPNTSPTYWAQVSTSMETTYHFTVSGVTLPPIRGNTYTNNSITYTVVLSDVSGDVGALAGDIVCTGSGDPEASGNLSRATGIGDSTIAFSAFTSDLAIVAGGAGLTDVPTQSMPNLGVRKHLGVSFTAEASVSIGGLLPQKKYMGVANVLQNSYQVEHILRFNSDSGTNYTYYGGDSFAAGTGYGGASGVNCFPLGVRPPNAGTVSHYVFYFTTSVGNDHKVLVTGHGSQQDYSHCHYGGFYSGGSDLTSIQLIAENYGAGAGTMTGTFDIYELL